MDELNSYDERSIIARCLRDCIRRDAITEQNLYEIVDRIIVSLKHVGNYSIQKSASAAEPL